MRWPLALALACVVGCASMAVAAATNAGPNRLALLLDLRDGAYESLDAELLQWQEAFERDADAEAGLEAAFRVFSSSDPTLERPLQEWVVRQPRSFAARLARGTYYRHLAELSRGSQAITAAPPQRLAEMERYDLLAAADFEAAIALRPRALVAHAMLVAIAADHGDSALLERRAQHAVTRLGPTFAVCAAYVGKFGPQRGGAVADLMAFIDTPQHRSLCGSLAGAGRYFVELASGQAAGEIDDVIAAIEHLSVAASLSDERAPRLARGLLFLRGGWYRGAIAEFDRIVIDNPDDADALFWRAWSKWRSNRPSESLADIDAAVALDPFNPQFLADRGNLLLEQDRAPEAAADFRNALRFGEYDEAVQTSPARALATCLQDPEGSAQAYERLVQLAPQNSRYWMEYATVLVQLRDCQAIQAAATFRSLCPEQRSCQVALDDGFYSNVLEELRIEQGCSAAE